MDANEVKENMDKLKTFLDGFEEAQLSYDALLHVEEEKRDSETWFQIKITSIDNLWMLLINGCLAPQPELMMMIFVLVKVLQSSAGLKGAYAQLRHPLLAFVQKRKRLL